LSTNKINRIRQKINSAECLINTGSYLDGASLYWQASRDYISYWLTAKQINFSSTNDAIRHAIQIVDSETREKIIQIEIIGTLSEWDEFFIITKEQAIDFKNNCVSILNSLDYGNN